MPYQEQIAELERELRRSKKLFKTEKLGTGSLNPNLPSKYKSYIGSANYRKLVFELTVEQFNEIIAKECVFCGTDKRVGVDRMDSNVGYIIGNVQPCCTMCNLMKRASSDEDFIKHISRILNHYKQPFV